MVGSLPNCHPPLFIDPFALLALPFRVLRNLEPWTGQRSRFFIYRVSTSAPIYVEPLTYLLQFSYKPLWLLYPVFWRILQPLIIS